MGGAYQAYIIDPGREAFKVPAAAEALQGPDFLPAQDFALCVYKAKLTAFIFGLRAEMKDILRRVRENLKGVLRFCGIEGRLNGSGEVSGGVVEGKAEEASHPNTVFAVEIHALIQTQAATETASWLTLPEIFWL